MILVSLAACEPTGFQIHFSPPPGFSLASYRLQVIVPHPELRCDDVALGLADPVRLEASTTQDIQLAAHSAVGLANIGTEDLKLVVVTGMDDAGTPLVAGCGEIDGVTPSTLSIQGEPLVTLQATWPGSLSDPVTISATDRLNRTVAVSGRWELLTPKATSQSGTFNTTGDITNKAKITAPPAVGTGPMSWLVRPRWGELVRLDGMTPILHSSVSLGTTQSQSLQLVRTPTGETFLGTSMQKTLMELTPGGTWSALTSGTQVSSFGVFRGTAPVDTVAVVSTSMMMSRLSVFDFSTQSLRPLPQGGSGQLEVTSAGEDCTDPAVAIRPADGGSVQVFSLTDGGQRSGHPLQGDAGDFFVGGCVADTTGATHWVNWLVDKPPRLVTTSSSDYIWYGLTTAYEFGTAADGFRFLSTRPLAEGLTVTLTRLRPQNGSSDTLYESEPVYAVLQGQPTAVARGDVDHDGVRDIVLLLSTSGRPQDPQAMTILLGAPDGGTLAKGSQALDDLGGPLCDAKLFVTDLGGDAGASIYVASAGKMGSTCVNGLFRYTLRH